MKQSWKSQVRKASTSFVPFGLNVTEAVITGPSIASNKPTRKRVPTNTKNSLSPQDLSLLDEDDRNDTSRAEQGNSTFAQPNEDLILTAPLSRHFQRSR